MSSYYYDLMKDWGFTKHGETPTYYIGGLGYRSENTLRQVARMEIGDSIKIGSNKTITRTK